ncbi:MAG TPA: TonB-dependent receptor, partial [Bacteroidota bacterium]|nr:TonB-dependent receptor [Bacteroidota bacterium]
MLSTAYGYAWTQTVRLAGTVLDSRTHDRIEGAVVSVIETSVRCETDTSGAFAFTLATPARYTLSVHRIGYAASERVAAVSDDAELVIELSPVMLQADEVVVRSTRVHADVNTSSIPFAVMMEEDLAHRTPLTVADAMRSIPGVSLVRDGSWETAVSIRGMSRSNIVMLVDNTRIETANDIAAAFSLVDIQELERVETEKSPGSSIWGSGAIGGVVHMMTKKPAFSETPDSHLQLEERGATVNGLMSHHISFDHSSPRFGVRLALGLRRAGNTQTPEGEIPNSQFRDFNLSTSVCVKTLNAQTLSASYQRSQAEDTGIPGGAAIASAAKARYTLAARELFAAEYSIPEVSSTVDLVTLRVSRQVIRRNVEIIQSPALTLTPHAVHGTTNAQLEGRLQPHEDLTLTAGIDAWQRSLESRRERINTVIGETIGERPVPVSSYLSAGSYIHGLWKAAPDRITIDAGARFDWIRVSNETTFNPEYTIRSGGIPDTRPMGLLWNAQTVNNHSWSGDAGVTLSLSPNAMLSLLAATAFRSPSLEERFQYIDLGSVL